VNSPVIFPADEATFWPLASWPEIAALPRKGETLVVIPVVGMADWGLGQPLYLEEIVLSCVMRQASGLRGDLPLLVTPPVRFVVGPDPRCAFPVSPPVACALLEEIVLSVRASGFTKVVFLNSSPWNEELCDAVARDLRIGHGVQMFCVNLSALGLDLDPSRNPDRAPIASLFLALGGTTAETVPASPASPVLPAGCATAKRDDAALHLLSLLREIHGRPPLADLVKISPGRLP
jgi:creatinine amidohydrolase